MKVIAFDIETVVDQEGLVYEDYKYLFARGKKEKTEEEFIKELSFNPFTSYIVSCAGVVIEDEEITKGVVFYISNCGEMHGETIEFDSSTRINAEFKPEADPFPYEKLAQLEKSLLEKFWKFLDGADAIVSFNGKNFDLYFMKVRSMLHGIEIPPRFLNSHSNFHIDLMEFLSDKRQEKSYKFDFVCKKFGINTPKRFMDGSMVMERFKRGDFKSIALYNLYDAIALAKLYLRLKDYLRYTNTKEKPSERQKWYFIDLLHNLTGIDKSKLEQVFDKLTEVGVLDKQNISICIDVLKSLKEENPTVDQESYEDYI
ncbi:MAG: hypothetical protein D6699_02385 [Aquificota bacterium]|nr:MAG: hypothetical protein D6699_02385 [Aquificota bacterium]